MEEEVFETRSGDSPSWNFETSVKQTLRTSQGRERCTVSWGRWDEDTYVSALLSGDKKNEIDVVYGVYVSEDETMLGDKRFDLEANDSMIIDGIRREHARFV